VRTAGAWLLSVLVPVILIAANVFLLTRPAAVKLTWGTAVGRTEAGQLDPPESLEVTRAFVVGEADRSELVALGGVRDPLYDEGEISHLEDVRVVIVRFWMLGALAALLLAAALTGRASRSVAGVAVRRGARLTIGFVLAVTAAFAVAWGWAFETFHGIFFAPGTWRFPHDSQLIRLFPEAFWQLATGILVLLTLVEGSALALVFRRNRLPGRRQESGSGQAQVRTQPPPTSPTAYRLALWLLRQVFGRYIHTRISGVGNLPPPGEPTIIAFNHGSALDYAIGHALDRAGYYAIKREAAAMPLIGRFIRAIGGIPIRRDEQDMEALRSMIAVLRSGELLGIAPEGTRSRSGAVGEFDPGFVWLAARTGAWIVPTAVHGTRDLLPAGSVVPKRGTIWVRFGEAFRVESGGARPDKHSLREHADSTRQSILDLLSELEAESGIRNPALDERRQSARRQVQGVDEP